MFFKSLCTLTLIVMSVRSEACNSCGNVEVECGAETTDIFNGVATITYGTDDNGCRTMKVNCTDDLVSGDPTAVSLTTALDGYLALSDESVVVCNADGSWFGQGKNAIVCQITRNIGGNEPVASATCKSNRQKREACVSQWSQWKTVSSCSDTCGAFFNASYSRTCLTAATCPCEGPATRTKPCNANPCGFPRNSCSSLYKALPNNGEILCSSTANEVDPYPNRFTCCPEGGIWGAWIEGSCNDTCGGFGVANRRRTCLTESAGCNCTGDKIEVLVPCKRTPCVDVPATREPCTKSLALGVDNGVIMCVNVSAPLVKTTSCCPGNGLWEAWSAWSSCASQCGGCSSATRTRSCASAKYGCPCDNSTTTETMPCNRQVCTNGTQCCSPLTAVTMPSGEVLCYPANISDTPSPTVGWTEWAAIGCTANCGNCGVTQYKRTCLGGNCAGSSVMNSTEPCGGTGLCLAGLGLPSCCLPAVRTIVNSLFACIVPSK